MFTVRQLQTLRQSVKFDLNNCYIQGMKGRGTDRANEVDQRIKELVDILVEIDVKLEEMKNV